MTLAAPATWPDAFEEIRRDFGFPRGDDEESARRLAARLAASPYGCRAVVETVRSHVRGRTLWVLGAADSALGDVERAPPGDPLWTADGATTAALAAGRRPDAIVTDLDGHVPDQVAAARAGAYVFVHAHGDNTDALDRWLEAFPGPHVAGTCQVEPPSPLLNPGGFTDGDRAVHLALALGAAEVRLIGFDLGGPPGRYSGRYDPALKPRKLAWAGRLIERLVADGAPVRFG